MYGFLYHYCTVMLGDGKSMAKPLMCYSFTGKASKCLSLALMFN